jgi:uncharacterized protein (DUF983 family)
MEKPSPFIAGVTGRCPMCGEGSIFNGMLKLATRCDACDADFEKADIGDGASVFVIFFLGLFALVLYLLVEVAFRPPVWVHILIQMPMIPVMSIMMLRPIKGILFALQFANDASQGELDE